jgi:RNA polymerase sigma-70 factor (ECF subfamily)
MMAHASPSSAVRLAIPSWQRENGVGMRRRIPPWARMTEIEPGSSSSDMTGLLVEVGAKRDRAAFQAIFLHFAPRVKSYLLRLGASSALADDLAQEAMLTIWRKAQLFDPGKASASTWIFTIARNLRIDAIRRERRPEFDPNDPAFVPDEEPQADDQMVRNGDGLRLRAALTDLSEEQAQVIRMSFFSDMPHSQIAKELGIPLGTVKSRLRLAMARIRTVLGDAI